jgi:hypothetical protein
MAIEPIGQLFGLGARFRQYRESPDQGPSLKGPRVSDADAVIDEVIISSAAERVSDTDDAPYLFQAIAMEEPTSPEIDTSEFLTWLREAFERAHGREIAAMAPQEADVKSSDPSVVPEPPVLTLPPPVLPPVTLPPPLPAPAPSPALSAGTETTLPGVTKPAESAALSPTRYGHELLLKRLQAYLDSLQIDDASTARWLASVLRDLLQKHQGR